MAAPHGTATPSRSTPTVSGAAASARSPMKSTQLFGGAQQGGATPGSTATQTFGAVPPAAGGASAGATQTYGAAARGPDNGTQAFGAVPPVSPQASGAASRKPDNGTQVFGSVTPVGATQNSGAASRGTGSDNGTQAFGAVPPVGVTRAFGATSPGPGSGTQAFGAVPPVSPQASGVASRKPDNGTQVFGAVAPVGTTQTFGSAPRGTGPDNGTQVFGAVPPVSPVGATRASGAASPGPDNDTQAFGVVPPVGTTPPYGATSRGPDHGTQAFGALPAAPPVGTQSYRPVPSQGAPASAAPGSATQAFGAVPPVAPVVRTQSYGAVSGPPPGASGIAPPAQAAGTGAAAPGNTTQVFGVAHGQVLTPPPVSPLAVGAPSGATPEAPKHAFGTIPASDARAPLGRSQTFSAVPEAPVGSKSLFGSVPPVAPPAELSAPRTASPEAEAAHTSRARGTQPFGLSALPESESSIELPPESDEPFASPGGLSGDFGAMPSTASLGATAQSGSAPRRPPVELPPELLAAGRVSTDSTLEYASGASSSVRPKLLVALLVGLALIAALAYSFLKGREAEIPSAVVEETDRAAVLLRRDDSASREQAIQHVRAVIAKHPRYVEAQAELAVALALNLSDRQADSERLRLKSEAITREKATATKTLPKAERELRLKELQQEAGTVASDAAAQRASIDTLRKELDTQRTLLSKAPEDEPAPAATARLRAQALHAAVLAAPDALALAERLRNAEGAPHVWSTLVRAEYALSANSPPDTLVEVSKALETLRQADSSLLRTYVLGARLALRQKDPAAARSLLDDALALNPGHSMASRLIAQIDATPAAP